MARFVTPPHGVQVTGVSIEPVIINVIPAVKVYLDSVLLQCRYSCSTDQGGVPFIYSFQSLGRLKTRLGALERGKGKRTNIKLNVIQKVERTNSRIARIKTTCVQDVRRSFLPKNKTLQLVKSSSSTGH